MSARIFGASSPRFGVTWRVSRCAIQAAKNFDPERGRARRVSDDVGFQETPRHRGGAFLARNGRDVFNTFVLALPTGETFTHDKDFPTTSMESSLYAGGEDDEFVKEIKKKGIETASQVIPSREGDNKSGVFALPDGTSAGAAMCWEQVRYRTARRMRGQVDIVLTGSGWPGNGTNPAHIQEMPRRLARLVGAPVVHASIVGPVPSANEPDGVGSRTLQFSGESQIVNAHGQIVAIRRFAEGEGVLVGEIAIGRVMPSEAIPDGAFWTPERPADSSTGWHTSGSAGRAILSRASRRSLTAARKWPRRFDSQMAASGAVRTAE